MSKVALHFGDSEEIAPLLSGIDAIVTDPPWGVRHNTNYQRFTGGTNVAPNYQKIEGDDVDFDPDYWFLFPKVALFGFQAFSDKLPPGSVLVWQKKDESVIGRFLSDCELIWMKGGYGVYLFKHVWSGWRRDTERGKSLHPTQKPIALMERVLELLKLKPGQTVLDPFMGSGSTVKACIRKSLNCVGIEKDYTHFSLAIDTIRDEAEEHGRVLAIQNAKTFSPHDISFKVIRKVEQPKKEEGYLLNGSIRVTTKWACFGMIVRDDVVVQAAPIARWCEGKSVKWCERYWRGRGAEVEMIVEAEKKEKGTSTQN